MIVTRRSIRMSVTELAELKDHLARLIESNQVLKEDVRDLQAQLAVERERLGYPWEREEFEPVPPHLIRTPTNPSGYLINSTMSSKCDHEPGSVPGCPWCGTREDPPASVAWGPPTGPLASGYVEPLKPGIYCPCSCSNCSGCTGFGE